MTLTAEGFYPELVRRETRPNPYPIWKELAKKPLVRMDNGMYAVTGYEDCRSLFQDPRLSSDGRKAPDAKDDARDDDSPAFVGLDAPEHDRLRASTMKHFGPPERATFVAGMRTRIEQLVNGYIDDVADQGSFDVAKVVGKALPVAVISEIVGMPLDDQDHLGRLAELLTLEPEFIELLDEDGSLAEKQAEAVKEVSGYFTDLMEEKRRRPDSFLLSRLVNDTSEDAMTPPELLSTAMLLLLGGHETTSSLIGNAMVQLLRHPEALDWVRASEDRVVPMIEEVLRFDPPVQFRFRTSLAEVQVADGVIPAGATVILATAAANRDARIFADPHRFDPSRPIRPHLTFGSGVHFCFGAPLGRLEGQVALRALTRRLVNPRLSRPPEYGLSPETRGPTSVMIDVDGIARR